MVVCEDDSGEEETVQGILEELQLQPSGSSLLHKQKTARIG